ncbi:MAG TPA: hypothetical protein PLF79_08665 [Thauera sp.]|uniref:hypothetical protein n=1 Tax=Thauera sp. TaxID=1905334 RepID=UPI002C9EACA8|nr:hypothetical protein [Thauera sp.]HRP23625.1 hypothetical protein [Thauera sp.]HRP66130.1 hypothetical protein [Thauera sp.]
MAGPEYKVKFSGDTAGLSKAARQAEGILAGLSKRVSGLQQLAAQTMAGRSAGALALLGGTGASAAIAAASAVGAAMVANAARVATMADEFGKLSQRTGVAVEDLSKLAYAASLNDATLADLEQGLKGLSNKMQEGSTAFSELGVAVRDGAGNMRPVKDVLFDLANAFQRLPDGAQKAALANKLMEESGVRLIPLLNNGAEGLRAMADEAERFGVTVSAELAERSAELNDNIVRMKASATGLANELGEALIPALASFTSQLLQSRAAGEGWGAAIWAGLFGAEDPAERIRDLTKEIARLRGERAKMERGELGFNARIDTEIAAAQKSLAFYRSLVERQASEPKLAEEKAAAERKRIEQDLAHARQRMFDFIAVKHGLASEVILKDGAERHKAEMRRAKELAAEYQKTYDTAVQAAKKADEEAQALLRQASTALTSRGAQAQALRDRNRDPAEISSEAQRRSTMLIDEARRMSVFAQNAALDGRAEKAQEYSEKALELSKEAADYANKIGDTDFAARLVDQIGQIEKASIEAQARIKRQEADQFDQDAQAQLSLLQEQLSEIARLKNVEIDADISKATAKVSEIQSQLDALPPKKVVEIEVRTKGTGGATGSFELKPEGSFATGGLIRGRGTSTSDSILARLSNGEYVIRAAAVQRYGVDFFERINAMLPRYATGGLVSNVNPGRLSAAAAAPGASGTPIVLNWPDGTSSRMSAESAVADEIVRVFRRASLQRGRRK